MFSEIESNLDAILGNEYYSAAIVLFLSMYAGRALPDVPKSLVNMLQHSMVRFLVLFLLAYNINKDPMAAIVGTMTLFGFMCLMDGSLETFNINTEEFEVEE